MESDETGEDEKRERRVEVLAEDIAAVGIDPETHRLPDEEGEERERPGIVAKQRAKGADEQPAAEEIEALFGEREGNAEFEGGGDEERVAAALHEGEAAVVAEPFAAGDGVAELEEELVVVFGTGEADDGQGADEPDAEQGEGERDPSETAVVKGGEAGRRGSHPKKTRAGFLAAKNAKLVEGTGGGGAWGAVQGQEGFVCVEKKSGRDFCRRGGRAILFRVEEGCRLT